MIDLTIRDYVELIVGGILLWFGVYVISRNPFSKLFWLVFALFVGFGFTIFADSILLQSPTVAEYIIWQKISDWPLFLAPIFFYHISLVSKQRITRIEQLFLILGYIGSMLFYILDIKGGLILKETEIRLHNFRRMDGFEPGTLLLPSIGFVLLYILSGTISYFLGLKDNFFRYIFPMLSGIMLILVGIIVALSYYMYISWSDHFFTLGVPLSLVIFAYGVVKHQLFGTISIFDRSFFYRSIAMLSIILLYILSYSIFNISITFPIYVFVIVGIFLLMVSHSFYDWLSTFINDLVYNAASGFSIVNDEEISHAVRNYNKPEKLEDSSLLRLKLLKNDKDKVDSLRSTIKNSIEYFKPDEDESVRNKKNLKYKLLKMIMNEAEEGQILWELGFEEYPVKILTQENKTRKPLFQITAPSDYSYTSRNAYIALKKEAIHDVAWRISYLEKLSRK